MPRLLLEHTQARWSKEITTEKPRLVIGRSPEADVFLDDEGVSKRHVLVGTVSKGLAFRDLGSLNGTFHNGKRKERGLLRDGDELLVGSVRIVVHGTEPAGGAAGGAAAPPAAKQRPAGGGARSGSPSPVSGPQPAAGGAPPSRPWLALGGVGLLGLTLGLALTLFLARDDSARTGPSETFPTGNNGAVPEESAPPRALVPVVEPGGGGGGGDDGDDGDDRDDRARGAETAPVAKLSVAAKEEPGTPPRLPGLADDPLGAYADPAESYRVLIRLYYDLLERPPTRAEARGMLPVDHQGRWRRLQSSAPVSATTALEIAGTFERFLARQPTEEEVAVLRSWPAEALLELGLWLSATSEYRAPAHRREKDLGQLARALLIDVEHKEPNSFGDEELLERAIVECPTLDPVTRTLAAAAPPREDEAALEGSALRAWIHDETFRFLQRLPGTEDTERLAALLNSPEARGWFIETLAASREYRRY